MPDASGAQSLGVAKGSIVIDVSDLRQLQALTQQIGQTVSRNLGQIDATVKQNQLSLKNWSENIRQLRGELATLSVGAGLATLFGVDAAKDLRNYTIAFNQFTGSQKESAKVMDSLTQKANQFGLEVEGVWQLGRSLLPILQGNTAELDKWVERAALLRSVLPGAQQGAETRAITEFMAGQDMSLQRLFNVPPALIEQAKRQFSDVGQQLDYILGRMGATEKGAEQMADAFVSVRNELKLIAAQGFTPLLQAMTPILHSFADWLSHLRETHQGLVTAGAGFITFIAAATPAVLLIERMARAAAILKDAGLFAGLGGLARFAAPALGPAAAVGGGFALGVGIDQAIGSATGAKSFQNITFMGELQKFGDALHLAAATILDFTSALNTSSAGLADILAKFARMVGLESLANNFSRNAQGFRDQAAADAAGASQRRDAAYGAGPLTGDKEDQARSMKFAPVDPAAEIKKQWYDNLKRIEQQANEARVQETQQYESQRSQVISQYELTIAREAEDFGRQRARQEQQLAKQIADIHAEQAIRETQWARDLADSIASEQEASAKRIADIEHQAGRNIEKVNEETTKNVNKIEADSAKDIAKLREASNDNLAKIEADYAKQRERAEQQHRDNLFTAAGNLDAKAVAAEQRRYTEEQANATQDHADRIATEKQAAADRIKQAQDTEAERIKAEKDAAAERIKNERESMAESIAQERASLAERISQEQADYDKRIQDARAADLQRELDLKASLAEQEKQEDEDRALRLARMAEDHQRQLAELDNQHQLRLTQIADQQQKERDKLDDEFQAQLDQLGIHNKTWMDKQKEGQHDAEIVFEAWWNSLKNNIQNDLRQFAPTSPDPAKFFEGYQTWIEEFAHYFQLKQQEQTHAEGGAMFRTHAAIVHSGEYILPKNVVDRMGGFNRVAAIAEGYGGNRTTLTVGDISFHIVAAPGQSPADIGAVVEERLMSLFQRLG